MKNLEKISFLILLNLVLTFKSFSQEIITSLSLVEPSSGFFLLEPGKPYGYSTVYQANEAVSNLRNIRYEWSVTGGTIATGTNGTSSTSVTWDNSTSSKSISAKVIYDVYDKTEVVDGVEVTKYSARNVTKSTNTQSITVKYIGNVNSISINGVENGNGGSSQLPCSTNSLTISCSIPETNPNISLVYTWTFPSDWSPTTLTTTTNSVSVSPSQNTNGIINVSVRRFDGETQKSASISITRPQFSTPTFTSYGTSQAGSFDQRILCSATTFEVTGGNATGYLWQGSGGVSASGTGNSGFISGNADGEVKVYPQSACGTGSQYAYMKVKVSSPDASQFVVANTPYGAPIDNSANTQYFPICKGTPTFVRFFPKGATSSTLELLPGSYGNSIELWGAGAIIGTTNTGYSVVRATASNCFGSSSHVKYFNIMNCGSYYSSYSISPNPTSSLLAVTYDDQTTDDNLPDNITLYDKNGKEYFSEDVKKNTKKKLLKDKKVSIDVSHFPKGIYFLHIRDTENPEASKQLEKIRVIVE